MVSNLWRFLKRCAVFIPGIAIAYLSAREIFPYFNKRLPFAIAVLITYVIGAYILIPAILRLWRIIVPAKHLPLYCVTPDGYASDPLNIGLIGSRKQLIAAMQTAGWYVAEPYTPRNVAFEIIAFLLKKPYNGAPMSRLYLFGRKQDIGFEMQLTEQEGRGHRRHVRFWATTFDDIGNLSAKTIHWDKRKEQVIADKLLWVGAASQDVGITVVMQSLQITHMVTPDTDNERAAIVQQLTEGHLAEPLTTIRLNRPYKLANRAFRGWRGYLQSDGKMAILRLKKRS